MLVVKVNTDGVRAMAQDLAQSSGQPYVQVLRSETGSMIKIAALRQKIASKAAIQRDVFRVESGRSINGSSSEYGRVTFNTEKSKDRTWFVPPGKTPQRGPGGTFRMVYDAGPSRGQHLAAGLWPAYLLAVHEKQAYIAQRIKELYKRRGLMRLSWLQMGDALPIALSSISPMGNLQEDIARGARGPGGRTYANGTVQAISTKTGFAFQIRNVSPLAIKNRGQEQLDKAIAQRVKGFQIAMAKGVLTDLKLRAVRWRGIFVEAA